MLVNCDKEKGKIVAMTHSKLRKSSQDLNYQIKRVRLSKPTWQLEYF